MVFLALADASTASATSAATVVPILSGLIAALIAIAGGVGTWAALRVAKNSQLISNYEAAAASWEKVANGLKAEKEGLEDQMQDMASTVTELQAKNSALQDLVTGSPAVEKLSVDMGRSFNLLVEQMNRIESKISGAANGG